MSGLSSIVRLPKEQEALRARCFHPAGQFEAFPKEDVEGSIPDRFEKIVAKYPHRIAVAAGLQSLTYEDLDRTANRIAHAVLACNGDIDQPIALLFKQGASMIAASLGVMKAGRAFSPLDYAMPRARMSRILDQLGSKLILTEGENLELAQAVARNHLSALDLARLDRWVSEDGPKLPISPDAIASIHFTSGSTGAPKGVMSTHRGELHNIMKNTQALHISPDDRLSLLRSNNVGAARDMFLALLNGATLCPLDLKERGLVNLGGWLAEQAITVYTCVTTVYRQSVQDLPKGMTLPDVRLIHVGGEPVLKTDVELYKRHFPDDCLFVVRYSISETPAVCYYFVDKTQDLTGERVPVGYPLEGNEISIVDEQRQKLGPNEVGEIAVTSQFLAAGYWREPELTRTRFLPDPNYGNVRTYLTGDIGYLMPDGCLVHMGRKDFVVKIRGFRVETGEVESALLALQEVKEAAVMVSVNKTGEKRLVAYVVPERDGLASPATLGRLLREKLPDYMIPQRFVMLNAMPLTANGKIDRKALPDPGISRSQLDTLYEAPGTSVEEKLVKIWAEVLDIGAVGIHDDFIELGGHSLLATRIIAKVNEVFGVELSMRSLLDVPTVAGLAKLVTALTESRKNAQGGAGAAAGDEEAGEL